MQYQIQCLGSDIRGMGSGIHGHRICMMQQVLLPLTCCLPRLQGQVYIHILVKVIRTNMLVIN